MKMLGLGKTFFRLPPQAEQGLFRLSCKQYDNLKEYTSLTAEKGQDRINPGKHWLDKVSQGAIYSIFFLKKIG
jgi:hypothetical protein